VNSRQKNSMRQIEREFEISEKYFLHGKTFKELAEEYDIGTYQIRGRIGLTIRRIAITAQDHPELFPNASSALFRSTHRTSELTDVVRDELTSIFIQARDVYLAKLEEDYKVKLITNNKEEACL